MAATPEEQNLALLDQADFDGWNGPDWAILREMHTDDVYVEWNGKVTDGYAAHEAVLRSVTAVSRPQGHCAPDQGRRRRMDCHRR
jgi:hypothetical protein